MAGKAVRTEQTEDAQKRDALLTSLANAASVTDACAAANVGRSTYYEWLNEDPEFAREVAAAKASRIHVAKDVAFGNLLKSATDPRYQTSLIAWLNNEGGWQNPQRYEHTGANGGPVQIQNLESLSDQDLDARINELKGTQTAEDREA